MESPIIFGKENFEHSEDTSSSPKPISIKLENQVEEEDCSEDSLFKDVKAEPDGIITREMIEEENRNYQEISREDEDNVFRRNKQYTATEKEQSFKRLLELLSRSQLYAEFLKSKIEEQKEAEKRKMAQEEKKLSKLKQKENLSASRHTHRGDLQRSKSPPESAIKRKGRKRSSSEDKNSSQTQKRKKLEEIKLNDECEYQGAGDLDKDDKLEVINAPGEISERQPELLSGGVMREYQLEGYEWMKVLYENGVNGILADEMGLGKTIQCIALLAHLVGKNVQGPFLICAPLSTLPNWLSEFQRFTPEIPVLLYHGKKETRDDIYKKIKKGFQKNGFHVLPVVLTSYDIAIRDAKTLKNFQWRYLIVDEGHRLKNYNCRLVLELKKYHSANRLLLTGTPLQNNLSELWSLLNFLLPEIFDNLTVFESWFDVTAMTKDESDETIIAQEREKRIISTLHEILNPFLLRRTKTDVDLNLPPKKELMVYAPLTKKQELFYKATLDKSIYSLLKFNGKDISEVEDYGTQKRSCVKVTDYSVFERDLTEEELELLEKKEADNPVSKTESSAQPVVFKATDCRLNTRNILMPLRKICNHPYLLEYPLDQMTGEYRVDQDMVTCCGKLQVLDSLLPALRDRGHKVLLFSQMTSLLDIIEDYCYLRKYSFVRLDGKTSLEERGEIIKNFNTDSEIFLFLLSTRAGGLGINLASADTVIIYDSDWNPQCDLQAQDRCHRFGQNRPVLVYRLVTANTIDEKIVIRAAAKRKLEKMIMKKGRFSKTLDKREVNSNCPFSAEELKELLQSKDHSDIVCTDTGELFTPKQLEMLLDRTDMLGDEAQNVPREEKGIFKVLDTGIEEVINGCGDIS